ncbi:MAG TPA: MarR family transcriptional regulator [Solirubrobacterales bacterium]|nr:MarR family transcriptional regulator [Solirubrobacterales bacterium]
MIGPSKPPTRLPLHGLLEVAYEALIAEFLEELQKGEFSDIRLVHGCVFRYMKEEGLRLTEIAERGNMTKQSAGEVVDDLVARGYVERFPDPDDRRAKIVRLTERGEAAHSYGFGLLDEIEQRWGERYGAERIADLRATLEEIAAVEAPFAVPEPAEPEPAGRR